jgi:hypothetical protein
LKGKKMVRRDSEHADWFAEQLLLDSPGTCIELRYFGAWINLRTRWVERANSPHCTVSGWFTKPDRLASAMFRAKNVSAYMTVNPMRVDTRPERMKNKLDYLKKGEGTGDGDVQRIKWVVIDIDPVTGHCRRHENSTDEELSRCLDVARLVASDAGPESSTIGTSGNGAFVLVRTDLDNAPESRCLVAKYVKALSNLYSNEHAAIDKMSAVPSRMVGVPGSIKYKCPTQTEERPWRMVRLLPTGGEVRLGREPLDLVAWLGAHGVDPSVVPEPRFHKPDPSQVIRVPRSRPSGDRIARARHWLARQPGAVQGQDGSGATTRIAHCLVQGFDLSADDASTLMMEWNPTCSPPWSEEEIRRRIEYVLRNPVAGKAPGYMLVRGRRRGRSGRRLAPWVGPEME